MNAISCPVCSQDNPQDHWVDKFSGPRPDSLSVTDTGYGRHLPTVRCQNCAHVFCPLNFDISSLYQEMEDELYLSEHLSRERSGDQFVRAVVACGEFADTKRRWLDIGCGAGYLSVAAERSGFEYVGVEVSDYLRSAAKASGISVYDWAGLKEVEGEGRAGFDVISLIDVIEHVDRPREFLELCLEFLRNGGLVVVATPDFSSIAARFLGRNWWHVRQAHIQYFSERNLGVLLETLSLTPVRRFRPGWFFSFSELLMKLQAMLGWHKAGSKASPKLLHKLIAPVQLFDSVCLIYRKN